MNQCVSAANLREDTCQHDEAATQTSVDTDEIRENPRGTDGLGEQSSMTASVCGGRESCIAWGWRGCDCELEVDGGDELRWAVSTHIIVLVPNIAVSRVTATTMSVTTMGDDVVVDGVTMACIERCRHT